MTALSFVWVHPYSKNSRCDINMHNLVSVARMLKPMKLICLKEVKSI